MQVLDLAIDLRTFTTAYRHVLNPAIPKKADSDKPLEQLVLSVFSALYRVEMGAWYRILAPDGACRALFAGCNGRRISFWGWHWQVFRQSRAV